MDYLCSALHAVESAAQYARSYLEASEAVRHANELEKLEKLAKSVKSCTLTGEGYSSAEECAAPPSLQEQHISNLEAQILIPTALPLEDAPQATSDAKNSVVRQSLSHTMPRLTPKSSAGTRETRQ